MPYEHHKLEHNLDLPTLAEMTTAAIQILQQEQEGYFLLVSQLLDRKKWVWSVP